MTYVIALPCVDVKDRACVDECPVDCIYEGGRSLYIHPDECVDCGACEPVCPVEAIFYEDDLPDRWAAHLEDNAAFFTTALPGRAAPLGSPGGAAKLGPLAADTVLVSGLSEHPAEAAADE
ncbi:ferredoxin [Pseudonocardia benzenivorans]|uniref:Ferredoxin n=2 Tax=Pseudonocardia TaxID=1847 RepID=F4CUK5_PSEUX|nr:ferredoxin [Pseudonocardia dioxanivorans]AEA25395.1 4Fe-4S ferredoxin iron-sulfur binding domain-containing protein [Pseudonocardia dioxanivorans CB1190]GJF02365.1 (4Fe-4S)-binding protein [Pseudonocardia sp. D17]